MDSNVRSWIQLEIKDKLTYSQKDFYETYYYFSQLIKYDIDKEGISGLTERLAPALNFVSTQKMDRQDIVTYFPDIWGSFEVFVKKTLYLINPKTYRKLSKNPKSSLVNYLNELGFPVFVDEPSRTVESNCIYGSYQLRNTESHEYNKWSLRRFYEELNTCLCGYMIVTNHVLQDLKTAFSKTPNFVQPQFNDFNLILALNTFHLYPYNINQLQGLKKLTIPQKNGISYLEYDKDGKLLSAFHKFDDFEPELIKYSNITEGNKLIATSEKERKEYTYTPNGQLISVTTYDIRAGKENRETNKNEIQYLENGGIVIIHKKYSSHSQEYINETHYTYDSTGKLLHVKYSNHTFDKFNYVNDRLVSFKTSSNKHIDVKYLDEEIYFVHKEELLDETKEIIERHFHYEDGLLKFMKYYAPTPDGKDTLITLERHFEYY